VDAFRTLTGVAAPVDVPNVDTDRIIPARFLRKSPGPGYEQYLFHDLRFAEDGRERPAFVLNQPAFRAARLLVTAENFGCGSSREAAVWALKAYGIRCVAGPSFGDIFFGNCAKNGVLAIVLPAETTAALRRRLHERPGATMTVDLPSQTLTGPDGAAIGFDVDPFRKESLIHGHDEIALTLSREPAIVAFEARRRAERPWQP
jgi:3-isopropylmalate/(R)-2-methylmalate dehydratase small subunit